MSLVLFNSVTDKKEAFNTIKPKSVKIYVCGVTPYDTTHLGHAFTYLSFDALIRYLTYKGFSVNYVQNVTDIDDDILRKSREQSRGWRELGDFWTRRYLNDMKNLNALKPTNYVKATASIPRIIKIVAKLIKDGIAYESEGNVYFSVNKFKTYGNLSHFNKEQMILLLRERGGNPDDSKKKDKLDFIIWQGGKEGEPFWRSPWGKGRPGWHIECSAMIDEYLGEQIDIHGGGRDLIFPHHESEIAQSESYTGKVPFSRYFMHTAMVMFKGEKMSKSLGNLLLVSELLKNHSPNALRWMILSHHYRGVWEYIPEELDEAELAVEKLKDYLKQSKPKAVDKFAIDKFSKIMDDDLNTPLALQYVLTLAKSEKNQASVKKIFDVLGFKI